MPLGTGLAKLKGMDIRNTFKVANFIKDLNIGEGMHSRCLAHAWHRLLAHLKENPQIGRAGYLVHQKPGPALGSLAALLGNMYYMDEDITPQEISAAFRIVGGGGSERFCELTVDDIVVHVRREIYCMKRALAIIEATDFLKDLYLEDGSFGMTEGARQHYKRCASGGDPKTLMTIYKEIVDDF